MTTSADEPLRSNESSAEKEAADDQTDSDAPTSSGSETSGAEGELQAGEELPKWEPLTPELVEDAAIRGDFMLRFSVVVLAFLLACTGISETTTLVHLKTGQYIATHGWLPPKHDIFSYTAGDHAWVNLAWLFDLAAAGVYAVGGAKSLTLVKALLAAVTFLIVLSTRRTGISTWWGSVAAALALLVCYPQCTVQPELVTLLGISLTLWWLHRWQTEPKGSHLWKLVVLFVVWSNLDPRMFLGLAIFLLYAVGELVGSLIGRPGLAEGNRRKQLWTVLAVCFAASLLNPFGWNSLFAPVSLYTVEYPALRSHYALVPSTDELQYFSMIDPAYWRVWSHHSIAGVVLLAAAAISFVLNRSKVDLGHVFVFLGFVGFALAASHELAAASIVACVLATLNVQDWYRANFRQTYSIAFSEQIFSNGGRAVTVLAFFAVAYLAISGRLDGPDGRRTGLGFESRLQGRVDGMREALSDAFDDRPFNFRFRQGDVLIWIGKRPFVDSRVAVYAGYGKENLLTRHDNTRRALRHFRESQQGSGQPQVWKKTFDEFKVTHVIPRLAGPNPDYLTFFDLMLSSRGDWQLTRLDAVVAVLYRRDLKDPKLIKYRADRQVDFVRDAFRGKVARLLPRTDWARAPSSYEKFLALPRTKRPLPVQRALHYYKYLEVALQNRIGIPARLQAALAYLIIRNANAGLAEDPQNAEAYRVLGSAYEYLENLELQIARSMGGDYPSLLRYVQTLHAYSQSLAIDPSNANTQLRLFETYSRNQKLDLAERALSRFQELVENRTGLSDAEFERQLQNRPILEQLNESVKKVQDEIQREFERGTDRLQIAQVAYQRAGCVLEALRILEEADIGYFSQNLPAQQLQAVLLMEAGRSEDAFGVLGRLEGVAEQIGATGWRGPAALASLANADYARAVNLWIKEADALESRNLQLLLRSLPLAGDPRSWPLGHTNAAIGAFSQIPYETATLRFNAAVCQLEAGQFTNAKTIFHQILDKSPETPLRPLVCFYLFQVADELIDIEPPSDWIPTWPDMFEPETSRVRKK